MVGVCFIGFCVICLIIAAIMSYKGKVVLFANATDKILMFLIVICLLIGGLIENSANNVAILLYVVAGVCFLFSAYYSITKNKGNTFGIIITIFAKIGMIIGIAGYIIYLFCKSIMSKRD